MAITPVPTLTDIPSFPALADRAAGTYNSKAYEFGAHMADKFNGEIAAVAANVRNNALEAQQSAQAVGASAASAATNATNAARDAATAASAPGTNATSATSMAIGLGTKTFTLAQTGKLFGKGNTVTIAAPTGDNWMSGPITAFNSDTGEITVNVTNISGSGTFATWTVSLSGAAGLTGVVNELRAANMASAATVNLTAATGNLVHITGTTPINTLILTPGAERSVIFDGALTLTNSPGLLLPGGSNIITAAGDRALIRGDSNGAILTHYQRASGLAIRSGAVDLVGSAVISSAVANIDFLSLFTADYDKYVIEIGGLRPSADGTLVLYLAVGGAVDSNAANYAGGAAYFPVTGAQAQSSTDSAGAAFTLSISNVQSLMRKLIVSDGVFNGTGAVQIASAISFYRGTNVISGFRLAYLAGANATQGVVRVYGFKNTL